MSESTSAADEVHAGLPEERLTRPTPGEILLEEFLKPGGLSQAAQARAIGVPAHRINTLVHGTRAMNAEMDLRPTRYWGLSQGFFMRLQNMYDLTEQRRKLGDALERITPRAA